MSRVPEFPQLSAADYQRILSIPQPGKTIRVALDTDFDNEVDDWFALVWLLMQYQRPDATLNQVSLEVISIAPYSFRAKLLALEKAYTIYLLPPDKRTPEQQSYLDGYLGQIEGILALGTTPYELAKDPHLNGTGDLGVQGSYESVLGVCEVMGAECDVIKGATEFMKGPYEPVVSAAAERLVELALSASPEDPLYIISIGCPTNVASAILMKPEIVPNIVVVWDSGYPTNVTTLANDSLNLSEDLYASQVLINLPIPLVYVPGFYIAQLLNMSQADMDAYVKPSGVVGEMLYERYMNNPLFTFYGINKDDLFGRNWVLWDVANVAWLLNPASVPSHFVTAPTLSDDKMWIPNSSGRPIREAYGLSVNSIFPTFERQLQAWS